MGKRLYVGNLPFDTTETQLKELFAAVGPVASVKLIIDRATGQSRGFGFVEMGTDEQAQAAVAKMNGLSVGTRRLTVNEARPMEPRVPGSAPRPSGPRGGTGRPDFGGGFGPPSPSGGRGGGRGERGGGRGERGGGRGERGGGRGERGGGRGERGGGRGERGGGREEFGGGKRGRELDFDDDMGD